jgi:hypothetical protein
LEKVSSPIPWVRRLSRISTVIGITSMNRQKAANGSKGQGILARRRPARWVALVARSTFAAMTVLLPVSMLA